MKIITAPATGFAMVRVIKALEVTEQGLRASIEGSAAEEPEQGLSPPIFTVKLDVPGDLLGADPLPAVAAWLVSASGPFAGGVVVDDADEAFVVRRLIMLRDVRKRRDALQSGGATTPYGRVDTDQESMVKLVGAVTMAGVIGSSYADVWTMADGSDVAVHKGEIEQIGLLAGQHVSACQRRKKALEAEIAAAASLDALAAIDITTGWPA